MQNHLATQDYSPDELIEALNVVTRIGVLMLQSGAASFRTKDTMDRFAASLGIEQFDSFVTPTKIIGMINSRQHSYTRAMRVPLLGVNMARVSTLHVLSHHPENMTPAELSVWLDSLETAPPNYSQPVVVAAVAIACGCFAIILGGGFPEALAAASGAACSQFVRMQLARKHVNPYLITVVCAALASMVSYLLMLVTPASLPRVGLIASVLLLVPGVPLVTALLDLLHLDLISGVTRGVYAAILLMNIGVGMLLVLTLTGFPIV
jgi:uncharacterized membrane protein YjjP (DUF1212 family)